MIRRIQDWLFFRLFAGRLFPRDGARFIYIRDHDGRFRWMLHETFLLLPEATRDYMVRQDAC